MDHYQTLGISRNASQDEIDAAFDALTESYPTSKEIYKAYSGCAILLDAGSTISV